MIALVPYISDYLIQTPGSSSNYVIGTMAGMLFSIPFWIFVSKRVGKHRVWLFATFAKLGGGFGIRVKTADGLENALRQALDYDGPAIVEVMSDSELV